MNANEFKTLREELGLPINDLTQILNTQAPAIEELESSNGPIPDFFSSRLLEIATLIRTMVDQGKAMMQSMASDRMKDIASLTYTSFEDFKRYRPGDASFHHSHLVHAAGSRLMQKSATATGINLVLVPMIPEQYESWRLKKNLSDNANTRSMWAAMQLTQGL